MNRDIDRKRAWVSLDFHKLLKTTAAEEDKSILEFTRDLTRKPEPFEILMKKKKERRRLF